MNLYDFDDTIYDGDTCKDIVIYGLLKQPLYTLQSLFNAYKLKSQYKKGQVEFERVKETMLSFIFNMDNSQEFINSFVDSHMKKIKKYYKERQTENDVIVSASYEIWISVFAKRLGIKYVIATKTDEKGHIIGKNCKGEEKIRRINEVFKDGYFLCAYSDSSVDIPMLELANAAYVIEGNNVLPYVKDYKFKNNK